MLPSNRDKILSDLSDGALVLDIGGWAVPWSRADYVADALPYETRSPLGLKADDKPERFTANTWIVTDVNRRLPFEDNQFDYVVCSHVLEDIRDPLNLCREIIRVAKAGYIEVPSRIVEHVYGLEGKYAGYYHHRWLVEIIDGAVIFRPKVHTIHSSIRFHFPRSLASGLSAEQKVSYLFWENRFAFHEAVHISITQTNFELEAFREGIARPNFVKMFAEDPRRMLSQVVRSHSLLRRAASFALRRDLASVVPDPWASDELLLR